MQPTDNIKSFINKADPDQLSRMIKAETLGNTKEYNRLKERLVKEYARSNAD